ncbi:hypothetical protein A8C56_10160 [Niabella ginsenosidivorans]|uniref:histidine kinase n=1 Tax=Niabella ginsenosidivorans TaxID=1176587 RepID=A0A1A9I0W0_9BACT|nr:tetratricopeptide repeat-containing sensor histidine kinase [Niabella ginsenosidivorans]ANH81297.1 hypothetical protein A8C56_10160 [Niabella ginsenosidivorans]
MRKQPLYRFFLHLLWLTIVLFYNFTGGAQQTTGFNKDSLKRRITAAPPDTNTINTLLKLGEEYTFQSPDSAAKYLNKANVLSDQLHYPSGLIRYRFLYSGLLEAQGNFEEAIKSSLEAVYIAQKNNLKHLYAIALSNLAMDYQFNDQYAMAVAYYLKALPLLEKEQNPNLDVLYGNLSGVYNLLKQPDKAVIYARKSVTAAEQKNDADAKGAAYGNLGNVLFSLNELDASIQYSKKAYQAASEINDKNLEAISLLNIGQAYTEKKAFDSADAVNKKALPIAEALNDPVIKAGLLYSMAKNSFRQRKIHQAKDCLDTAILFAQAHDQKSNLAKMLLLMSDVQIAAGNTDRYVQYRNQYDSLNTALLNEPLLKNIQSLEIQYETQKKESEILHHKLLLEQKNRETTRQHTELTASMAGIAVLLLLLFAGYRFFSQRQLLDKKKLEALEAKQKNVRLEAMLDGQQEERQRISREMHDDMAPGLTSLLFLSRSIPGQNTVTDKLTNTARDLMQKMNEIIWSMNPEQDTLDSFIAYTRLHIAEMLDNAHLYYTFSVADDLPAVALRQELRRNIYLVMKEAVHNIIRHAAASKVLVTIHAEQSLQVFIQDDGKGIPATDQPHPGNGLKNMRNRMAAINGTLDIIADKGTRIILSVPLLINTGPLQAEA